jgi:hypothetical protein
MQLSRAGCIASHTNRGFRFASLPVGGALEMGKLTFASLIQVVGRTPQENGRERKNNREGGNDAFVVMLEKSIGASKKDQESPEERGAAMLIIIVAGAIVLIWVYETTRGVG